MIFNEHSCEFCDVIQHQKNEVDDIRHKRQQRVQYQRSPSMEVLQDE